MTTVLRLFRRAAILAAILLAASARGADLAGRVIDAATGHPLEDAVVTLQNQVAQTGKDGRFRLECGGDRLGVRAPGYRRDEIKIDCQKGEEPEIGLDPFAPKALYLSFFGIGHAALRQSALNLIEETELNALVIDVKGDRGLIAYKSAVPLAAEAGAQKFVTIRDIRGLIASLREKGIYTIARIVVFKDDPLASAKPQWAVKANGGTVWRDREDLAWTDPFLKEVWDYNIDIAEEAARNGFDEIQFDYVRFPDAPGLGFSMPNTEENRVRAVNGFLAQARERLIPYNVFLAADIFGYVCWNLDDTGIGQRLESLPPLLDYLSPMLYPSGFKYGIPGYPYPVENPYQIVRLTLKRAAERTGLPGVRFRPWLQAFRDYAFDRRVFSERQIRAQIQAAEDSGADGWMMWNPQNLYSDEGLEKAPPAR